jgi:hypothetical protein
VQPLPEPRLPPHAPHEVAIPAIHGFFGKVIWIPAENIGCTERPKEDKRWQYHTQQADVQIDLCCVCSHNFAAKFRKLHSLKL